MRGSHLELAALINLVNEVACPKSHRRVPDSDFKVFLFAQKSDHQSTLSFAVGLLAIGIHDIALGLQGFRPIETIDGGPMESWVASAAIQASCVPCTHLIPSQCMQWLNECTGLMPHTMSLSTCVSAPVEHGNVTPLAASKFGMTRAHVQKRS